MNRNFRFLCFCPFEEEAESEVVVVCGKLPKQGGTVFVGRYPNCDGFTMTNLKITRKLRVCTKASWFFRWSRYSNYCRHILKGLSKALFKSEQISGNVSFRPSYFFCHGHECWWGLNFNVLCSFQSLSLKWAATKSNWKRLPETVFIGFIKVHLIVKTTLEVLFFSTLCSRTFWNLRHFIE